MKKVKRLLALTIALSSVLSVTACGDKDSSGDSKADVSNLNESQAAAVEKARDSLPKVTLENTNIKWLAHYDINPGNGQVEPADLHLFKEAYGGTIEFIQTTYGERYNTLAKLVLDGNAPDFFPADDMDTFPKGAIENMFQPIDDYVDVNSDLWKDQKASLDQFSLGGKHYVAVVQTTPNYICVYNRNTIDKMGVTDPAELFADGKWTLDKFQEYCEDFTNADEDKYGVDGYWYVYALEETCGVPFIGIKDGKIVSNVSDPAIEKIQNFMYDFQKNSLCYPRATNNWQTRGAGETGNGIGSGLTLFVPVGIWALENSPDNTKLFGDMAAGDIMFVPMPKDKDSDTYYMSSRVNGYNICKGAPNPQGVAAYLNCKRVALLDDGVSAISTEQLKDQYKWSDDMIAMRETVYQMAAEHPVFEFSSGVSKDMDSQMLSLS
ncbi:MAG: extracellular solute-binding protein, partial [Oscillospiraceae bacterium]